MVDTSSPLRMAACVHSVTGRILTIDWKVTEYDFSFKPHSEIWCVMLTFKVRNVGLMYT